MRKQKYLTIMALLVFTLILGACSNGEETNLSTKKDKETEEGIEQLSGEVIGDGSSTVAPIMEAIVEEYAGVQKDVRVSIGVSGTGGGFEKFINGETDFSNASRPIKDEEAQSLKKAGIDYTEFEIAYDGISVVINPENTWATNLTVDQLKKLWIEDGTTKKWSDIDPSWPDEEVVFYSPGTDSGTFDYFDEVILDGEDLVKSSTLSEDDNVLVQGVSSDKYAIGFFGYSYYFANQDKLKAVSINGVEPSNKTIESGEYSPLSRSLFVYVKNDAIKNNDAAYDFMKFALENAGDMSELIGYVRLPQEKYNEALTKLDSIR